MADAGPDTGAADTAPDLGAADAALAAALASSDGSTAATARAHAALLAARVLVPVLATATDIDARGADKQAEMAVPGVIGRDGRRALPVFTSVATLAAWRPDARPVPMPGARALAGALGEGYDAVVVDLAGPHRLVVEGDDLSALGQGYLPVAGAPGLAVVATGDEPAPG